MKIRGETHSGSRRIHWYGRFLPPHRSGRVHLKGNSEGKILSQRGEINAEAWVLMNPVLSSLFERNAVVRRDHLPGASTLHP